MFKTGELKYTVLIMMISSILLLSFSLLNGSGEYGFKGDL
jgi:hypothetical protein